MLSTYLFTPFWVDNKDCTDSFEGATLCAICEHNYICASYYIPRKKDLADSLL